MVSKVEKVKSVSFLSGKKILRSGLLLCGILEEGLFGSNFPVILFLVEASEKTRHQIVTSLFQNKHSQQEENIFLKRCHFIHCHYWLCCKTWSFPCSENRDFLLVHHRTWIKQTMENFSKDKTICYFASCYDKTLTRHLEKCQNAINVWHLTTTSLFLSLQFYKLYFLFPALPHFLALKSTEYFHFSQNANYKIRSSKRSRKWRTS